MLHPFAFPNLVLCLLACLGYGGLWLRVLRHPASDPLRPLYAVTAGMGTLAYLVLAVGLLGFLRPAVLAALVGAGILLAVRDLWPALKGFDRERQIASLPANTEEWLAAALMGFGALLAGMTLLSALKPLDGLDWDSLSYHLAAPKIYLRDGKIGFISYDSHTHFPFTMQMLYTVGLAFGGAPGAKLFHWAAAWLTALALGLWTSTLRPAGERLPAWAGPLAAVAYGSMPLALWEMGTGYVDLGTGLFQLLALTALLDAWSDRHQEPGRLAHGALLAGVLTGFALGTKITALLQYGLLGLGLLWAVWRAGKTERGAGWRAVLLYGATGLVVASPWYVKSWLWVHNPVYPFFYSLFGGWSWNRALEEGYANEQKKFGMGTLPDDLPVELLKQSAAAAVHGQAAGIFGPLVKLGDQALQVFWNLAMHGRAFYITNRILLGDKIGSLGPLWAGILPLGLWVRGLGSKTWACLLYALASIGVWLLMTQQARYLMPVFAPLAVVVAVVVARLDSRPLRIAAGTFAGLMLALNAVMHLPYALIGYQVLTGQVSDKEYVASTLGGVYEASEFLNTLPPNVRVALYQETRGFYIDRPYFWANPGQHDLIPYERLRTGGELVDTLRKFGITHVLVNYGMSREVMEHHWFQLVLHAVQQGRLQEVFRSPGAEFPRRGVIVYELR